MAIELFLNANGRINRQRYWIGNIVLYAIVFVPMILVAVVVGDEAATEVWSTVWSTVWSIVIVLLFVYIVLYVFVFLYAIILLYEIVFVDEAATEAWGIVIVLLLVLLLVYSSFCLTIKRFHDRNKVGWWSLIVFVPTVGAIWILIECGFLKGTTGANDYGPDPLAPDPSP